MEKCLSRVHTLIDAAVTKYPEDKARCTDDAQAAFLAGKLGFAWQIAVAAEHPSLQLLNKYIDDLHEFRENGLKAA